MSTYTHESMINHHAPSLFSQVVDTIHVWRQRYRARRERPQWPEGDLHDIGRPGADAAYEMDKPFWRA